MRTDYRACLLLAISGAWLHSSHSLSTSTPVSLPDAKACTTVRATRPLNVVFEVGWIVDEGAGGPARGRGRVYAWVYVHSGVRATRPLHVVFDRYGRSTVGQDERARVLVRSGGRVGGRTSAGHWCDSHPRSLV